MMQVEHREPGVTLAAAGCVWFSFSVDEAVEGNREAQRRTNMISVGHKRGRLCVLFEIGVYPLSPLSLGCLGRIGTVVCLGVTADAVEAER